MYKYGLLLLLCLPFNVGAQGQDAQLLLYNVGFGGVTAGVGAIFNKPKGVNWKKAFVRAFWQGSIGGALHYSGKKTLYLINKKQEIAYGLPATLLHSAGSSMIENAAYNRPFLQSWHLNYGFIRFDLSVKDVPEFKARLLPATVAGIIYTARYGSPDWKMTLLTGNVSFKTDGLLGGVGKLDEISGLSLYRGIIYTTYYGEDYAYQTIAHELAHNFQFSEYQVFNAWLAPAIPDKNRNIITKLFSRYVYFDYPYFDLPYLIEGRHTMDHYYRNFFEMEAQRFATNQDVK